MMGVLSLIVFCAVWGGLALLLGGSAVEAVLAVGVALALSGYYQLSVKIEAIDKRTRSEKP